MVFVPRHLSDQSGEDEIRGPLPFTLAVVAIIGWGLAAYFASELLHAQHAELLRADNVDIIQACGPQP